MAPVGAALHKPWLIFNNCDIHIANDRDWCHQESFLSFTTFVVKDLSLVVAGNIRIQVLGIGNITLPVEDPAHDIVNGDLQLKRVLFAPDLEYNVVGMAALRSDGVTVGDEDGLPVLLRTDEDGQNFTTIAQLNIDLSTALTRVLLRSSITFWCLSSTQGIVPPVWPSAERDRWKTYIEMLPSIREQLAEYQKGRDAVDNTLGGSAGSIIEPDNVSFTFYEMQWIMKNKKLVRGFMETLKDPEYCPLD